MFWHYKDIGYSRKKAEEKVLSLGFESSENRGWHKYLVKHTGKTGKKRIHIVPSSENFNIHIDNAKHKVVHDKWAYDIIKEVLIELNKITFKEKVILIIKKILCLE